MSNSSLQKFNADSCNIYQMNHHIKFWLTINVNSKYVINDFPYRIKMKQKFQHSWTQICSLKVYKPYLHQGKNIITDYFFINISLAKNLIINKTSLIETSESKRIPKTSKKGKREGNEIIFFKTL